MNTAQLKKLCKALCIKADIGNTKGWVQMSCPLAEWRHQSGRDRNPSFGVKMQDGKLAKYHCLSCNSSGELYDLVLELRQLSGNDSRYDFKTAFQVCLEEEQSASDITLPGEDFEEEQEDFLHYFPEEFCDSFPKNVLSEPGYLYCKSRGAPTWVQKELDLRFDPVEQRVLFPIREFGGHLVGMHGRSIHPGVQPVYRMYTHQGQTNPFVWYGESWVDTDRPVVLVESVFDLARVYEVYKNVMSPLTASINKKKILRLQDSLFLFKLFDNDLAGRKASQKIKEVLPGVYQKDMYLPDGIKDPGELPVQELRKLLNKHIG